MRLYADTSALAKLVKRESETDALRHWLAAERPRLLSSRLVVAELGRMGLAYAIPAASTAALLRQLDTVEITDEILQAAARLPAAPGRLLRTLDAIHLASALHVEHDTVLTYDGPMTEAAVHSGLTVVAPR